MYTQLLPSPGFAVEAGPGAYSHQPQAPLPPWWSLWTRCPYPTFELIPPATPTVLESWKRKVKIPEGGQVWSESP